MNKYRCKCHASKEIEFCRIPRGSRCIPCPNHPISLQKWQLPRLLRISLLCIFPRWHLFDMFFFFLSFIIRDCHTSFLFLKTYALENWIMGFPEAKTWLLVYTLDVWTCASTLPIPCKLAAECGGWIRLRVRLFDETISHRVFFHQGEHSAYFLFFFFFFRCWQWFALNA